MTKATLIKESIELGLVYSVRGLVHYQHGGKLGCMQTDMILDKDLRVDMPDFRFLRAVCGDNLLALLFCQN